MCLCRFILTAVACVGPVVGDKMFVGFRWIAVECLSVCPCAPNGTILFADVVIKPPRVRTTTTKKWKEKVYKTKATYRNENNALSLSRAAEINPLDNESL